MLLNRHRHIAPVPPGSALDYHALLTEGIAQCQALGGDLWTDYNEHDPGVTILEQLCYTLTDLAYRTGFTVADLLAEHPAELDAGRSSLYTGNHILTSGPLTEQDYRKQLHSHACTHSLENFKNAWLEPVSAAGVSGLYGLLIETYDDSVSHNDTIASCRRMFMEHRNLCEDIDHVEVLNPCPVGVKANIEIMPGIQPEAVLADLLYSIQDMLVPFVEAQAVEQQLAAGVPPELVYRGPLLACGVIEGSQLAPRRRHVSVGDVGGAILSTAGVRSVSGLELLDGTGQPAPENGIAVGARQVARLAPSIFLPMQSWPSLVLTCQGVALAIDSDKLNRLLLQRLAPLRRTASAVPGPLARDYNQLPEGRSRDVSRYFSIQRQFPQTYGIGPGGPAAGLPQSEQDVTAAAERLAQARQLKGYLLFFEQLLADCASQLAGAGRLFSLDPSLQQSYFWQSLPRAADGPPDMAELLRTAPADSAPRNQQAAGPSRYVAYVAAGDGRQLRSMACPDRQTAYAKGEAIVAHGANPQDWSVRALGGGPAQLLEVRDGEGASLGFGSTRYASTEAAGADRDAMAGALAAIAQDPHAIAEAVLVAGRGGHSAYLMDAQGQALLSMAGLDAAEQTQWSGRLLRLGVHAANYRLAAHGDGWRVLLRDDNRILAEGASQHPQREQGEAAIGDLVRYINSLCCDPALRSGRIVLDPAPPVPTPDSGIEAYEAGMRALVRKTDPWRRRRNQFLDHLLARFNEHFDDAALRQADPTSSVHPDSFEQELIDSKLQLLSHYVEERTGQPQKAQALAYGLGGARMRGIGPLQDKGESIRSGLSSRMQLLLGIPSMDTSATPITYGVGAPGLAEQEASYLLSATEPAQLPALLTLGADASNYQVDGPDAQGQFALRLALPGAGHSCTVHHFDSAEQARQGATELAAYLASYAKDRDRLRAGEHFYVVEHVLLRGRDPQADAYSAAGLSPDFFSHRASIILPGAPLRFQSPSFRSLAQQMLAENCPAHVAADCLWLDSAAMEEFVGLHSDWLSARHGAGDADQQSLRLAQFIASHGPVPLEAME